MAAVASVRGDLDVGALSRFGVLHGTGALLPSSSVLSLGWPELEQVLPDRGFPRGVVEIASPPGKAFSALRGGAATVALAAIGAVHAADPRAWCAWITPDATAPLYAPAAVAAGVHLDRLLVVRPPAAALARTAIKVVTSGAFDLVAVDAQAGLSQPGAGRRARIDGSVVVRKLALAAEEKGALSLVLTNAYEAREVPWPVALRIEVERRVEALAVRVTKDRRGRAASQHVVRLAG